MTTPVMTDLLAYNWNLDTPVILNPHIPEPVPFSRVRQGFMHALARQGDVLSAEIMFDSGNAIDLPNDEGRRPLHEAAFFGHLDMVAFLIEHGADIDATVMPFGHTALYLAVQQSRYGVVKYLIKAGASLGTYDYLMGTGLLHIAAAKDDVRMAGILISSGVNVFHEDIKGQTARDIAARHGHKTLEQALLKVMEHQAKYMA
jgi:ankyrin repeat protein